MLEQIVTLAVSNVQPITAVLILAAVFLEMVHIGQTRRINKKLSRAGNWLQRYLNAVFCEETSDESADEDAQTDTAMQTIRQKTGRERIEDKEETERAGMRRNAADRRAQLEVSQPLKSRQEENMRISLAQKKQKKEEELLDTVLQEIFD